MGLILGVVRVYIAALLLYLLAALLHILLVAIVLLGRRRVRGCRRWVTIHRLAVGCVLALVLLVHSHRRLHLFLLLLLLLLLHTDASSIIIISIIVIVIIGRRVDSATIRACISELGFLLLTTRFATCQACDEDDSASDDANDEDDAHDQSGLCTR